MSSCVRQRIHIDLLLMTLMMLVARTVAQGQGQSPPQGLLAAAEAVVAVEIVSTDYTATAADGPMVAAAKILKVLKGPLAPGKDLRFSETAWVGPTYQKVSRILFLEKAAILGIPETNGLAYCVAPGCQDRFLHRERRPLRLVLAVFGRVVEEDDGVEGQPLENRVR